MKSYKKIMPQYWWDFGRSVNEVIIESTHKKYPVVARFGVPAGSSDARPQIERAEAVIAELESGRLTPKKAAEKFAYIPKKILHA